MENFINDLNTESERLLKKFKVDFNNLDIENSTNNIDTFRINAYMDMGTYGENLIKGKSVDEKEFYKNLWHITFDLMKSISHYIESPKSSPKRS